MSNTPKKEPPIRFHRTAIAAVLGVLALGALTAVAFAAGSPSNATTQVPDGATKSPATATAAGSRDDDGTADQGRGDAPGVAGSTDDRARRDKRAGHHRDRGDERRSGRTVRRSDDGTPDQGRGDEGRSGRARTVRRSDDGTADQGRDHGPDTAGSNRASDDDHGGHHGGEDESERRGRGHGRDDD